MQYLFFIGCDISKSKLNFSIWFKGRIIMDAEVPNKPTSIRKFIKDARKLDGFNLKQSLFCMEHTGIYNAHLLEVLQKANAFIALESGAQIKLSLGLQRGKDDVVDARRIAEYAARFNDRLTLWQPPRHVITQLRHLTTLRERLVSGLEQLRRPIEESKAFMKKEDWELLRKNCQSSLKAIEADIEKVEKQIHEIISQDDYLKKLFDQVTSVSGVGKITAHSVIISTNEFKDINDPRKFACHAGIAPFKHNSGSSIRGRTRVSHRANKKLKKLLHLCAMSAIRFNAELKSYYQRKVDLGKNKMSVLNAVRNKIVHRIFAVVRNNTTYQKNYDFNLVKP